MINENELIDDFSYLADKEYRTARSAEGSDKIRHKAKGDAFNYAAKKLREVAEREKRKAAKK